MPKRLNALAVAIVFVTTSTCSFFRAPPITPLPPMRLFVTSEVLQNMFEMWREYENETVRCLTGFVGLGTVHVMSMEPAWINHADGNSANFRACTQEDAVGWMHLHPGSPYADGWEPICEFSDVDIVTHRGLEFPIAIIVCAENTIVWRFLNNTRTFTWTGEVPSP